MPRKKRKIVASGQLRGFKYFKIISRMLRRLRDAGCKRDTAGNRTLYMDQYMTLLLMYMFNPVCSSMRALQEASQLKKVQRVLGVPRTSLGSMSEAGRIFDSQLLVGIIGDLAEQLKPIRHDTRLGELEQIITLVDGSWLKAVPKVAWAFFQDDAHKSAKVHMHFELLNGVPVAAEITDANTNENAKLLQMLQPGRLYVLDRGYFSYSLWNDVLAAKSSFVCRAKNNAIIDEVIEERELSSESLSAGIVRDAIVKLGHPNTKTRVDKPLRLIEVECKPHIKISGKTGRGGPEQGGTILIATDRLDLQADVISELYKHRWEIETFFRFFKHTLGCRHLINYSQNGLELQTYAAIIACLLIALWTGRKPTLSTYRMLLWHFSGWADEDELQNHIEKLKLQSPAGEDKIYI